MGGRGGDGEGEDDGEAEGDDGGELGDGESFLAGDTDDVQVCFYTDDEDEEHAGEEGDYVKVDPALDGEDYGLKMLVF